MSASTRLGFARLMLGTAQLSAAYGIANTTGQLSAAASTTLLNCAWENGLTSFDTARLYGQSERRIGTWIAQTGHTPRLITKFRPVHTAAALRNSLDESFAVLGVNYVDGLLAHDARALSQRTIADTLQDLQAQGRIGSFGASVYEPEHAISLMAIPGLSLLQLPLNAFDNRFIETGVLAKAASRGISIFARSPLLQGVLVMTPESLPSHLHVARTPLRRFRDHARAAGLTPSALALAMVLARPEVTSMVIGAELPIHINDAALAATLTLEETVISEAWQLAANLPRAVVNPSLWPKTD